MTNALWHKMQSDDGSFVMLQSMLAASAAHPSADDQTFGKEET
jgi:hypothetical protein